MVVAVRVFIPSPAIIDSHQANGTVYFSANHSAVWSPDTCITLRWQVDNIEEVYLNSGAQIGSGEVEDCSLAESPTLLVKFRDGSQQTYTLPVWVVAFGPLIPILAILGVVTALLYRHIPRQPKILIVALATLLITILIVRELSSLAQTAATINWLTASTALANIFSLGALVIFVVLILAARLAQPTEQQFSSRFLIATGGIGAACTVIAVMATILTVNPRGMYFSDRFAPNQLILRDRKTQGYFAFADSPDVLIMGSSRAFTLSPLYIYQQTSLTAYNMSIEGGRIEDFLIQARQLQPFPRVLMIEVQEGLPREPGDIAARAPLSWLPYMRTETALLTLQKRLEGLIDIRQFAEVVHIANYADFYDRQPKEWPEFDTDGFTDRPLVSASKLEEAILSDIGNLPPARCEGVDEISQGEVAQLIQIAESQNSALVFYISPLHPRYYDARLADEPEYQRCYGVFTAYMNNLTQEYEDVFFLDFSRLASIDGLDDETGYYDSQHLTEANSNRLIDHAAETLMRAAVKAN